MILSGGVPMSENGKRRSYDRAFKVEAVRLVTEEKRKVTEAARELGINANQLHRWKRKLAEKGEFAFLGKGAYSEPFRHLIPKDSATLFRGKAPVLKAGWLGGAEPDAG